MMDQGRSIGRGRLVRSASPHTLTTLGWAALVDYGITSIIDLRHDWEIAEGPIPAALQPTAVTRHEVPVEPPGYVEAWSERDDAWKLGTPLYYDEFMTRHRDRVARVLQAVATAPSGGVLVHCAAGRDRAGLVVAMILDLVGVAHGPITADHWLSFDRPQPLEVELGKKPVQAERGRRLDREGHATALLGFLGDHPARACFPSPEAAEVTRQLLAARL